jgi:alcohol dehydrogenase
VQESVETADSNEGGSSTAGGVEPAGLVTHRFKLDDIEHAYDVFGQAAGEQAIKMLLTVE